MWIPQWLCQPVLGVILQGHTPTGKKKKPNKVKDKMVQSYSLIRIVSVADAIKITFWMKIFFASALYKFYTSPSGPKTSVVILFLGGNSHYARKLRLFSGHESVDY